MAIKKQKAPETSDTGNVNDQLDAELAKTDYAGIIDLAENLADMSVTCVPTGFPQLDLILHKVLKGLPLGRDVEIYSKDPQAGKTSIALDFIRAFQNRGFRTVFIDVERTMTTDYLHTNRIITDPSEDPTKYALRIIRPEEALAAEEILDIVKAQANIFDLVVVDSIAAMDLKANLAKDSDEGNKVAGVALLLSNFLKKNVAKRACIVWVNQTRQVVGGYNPTGNVRYTTTGGRSMLFYGSIRLELAIVDKIKDANDETFAYKVKFFTAKNKLSPQWKTAILTYVFDEGFSTTYDWFDLALKNKIIEKKGGWLAFGDQKVQGELKFYKMMRSNPELFEAIKKAVEGKDSLGEQTSPENTPILEDAYNFLKGGGYNAGS